MAEPIDLTEEVIALIGSFIALEVVYEEAIAEARAKAAQLSEEELDAHTFDVGFISGAEFTFTQCREIIKTFLERMDMAQIADQLEKLRGDLPPM